MLKAILTALEIFKVLVKWFRERTIYDQGAKAERLRLIKSEARANDKAAVPIRPADVVSRLRDAGDEF